MLGKRVYKVFISSTYEDLKNERQKVIEAIIRMGHLPFGMELFDASSDVQWRIIADAIDEADYYVLIIGKRYGSIFVDGEFKDKS